jgi:DNA mismatch repair protein MutS2
VEKEAEKLRQKAMARFELEVREAQEEIARTIRELQKGKGATMVTAAAAREKVNQVVRKVREQAPVPVDPLQTARPVDPARLKVGDRVLVASLKREGTVQTLPEQDGGLLEVLVGGLRVKVWMDDLRQPPAGGAGMKPADKPTWSKAEARAPRPSPGDFTPQEPLAGMVPGADELEHAFQTSKNTLDLRGARVDEGLDQVERFLDKASLRGERVVFIIHGHGTGAMKAAVRDYLNNSAYVERHQPGGKGQGGDGATVVALR